jgi:hypothetical protein
MPPRDGQPFGTVCNTKVIINSNINDTFSSSKSGDSG